MVALLVANGGDVPVATIRSTLSRTSSAASSFMRSGFCLGKTVLNDDVFSFNLSQLAAARAETHPARTRCRKAC